LGQGPSDPRIARGYDGDTCGRCEYMAGMWVKKNNPLNPLAYVPEDSWKENANYFPM
jgi:hypothetical protein